MGAVLRAVCTETQEVVALKVALAELAADGERRLHVEWKTLARVSSPHLPRVVELARSQRHWGVVMQYLPGANLLHVLQRPLTQLERFALAERVSNDVANALVALEEAGIVHRDLKPENILFGADGKAILVDLGLAFEAERERLTATGMVLGTPQYLAPEQLRPEIEPTPSIDQYQLGLVIFDILFGMSRRTGEADFAQVIERCKHDLRLPECPLISQNFRRWLETCLASSSRDRHQGSRALLPVPHLLRSSSEVATARRTASGPGAKTEESTDSGQGRATSSSKEWTTPWKVIAPLLLAVFAIAFGVPGILFSPPPPSETLVYTNLVGDTIVAHSTGENLTALLLPGPRGLVHVPNKAVVTPAGRVEFPTEFIDTSAATVRYVPDPLRPNEFVIPVSLLPRSGDILSGAGLRSDGTTTTLEISLRDLAAKSIDQLLAVLPVPPEDWMGGLKDVPERRQAIARYLGGLNRFHESESIPALSEYLPKGRATLRLALHRDDLLGKVLDRLYPALVRERLEPDAYRSQLGLASALVCDFWEYGDMPSTPKRFPMLQIFFSPMVNPGKPLARLRRFAPVFSGAENLAGTGKTGKISLPLHFPGNELQFIELGLWVTAERGNFCLTVQADDRPEIILPIPRRSGWNHVFLPSRYLIKRGAPVKELSLTIGILDDPSFETIDEVTVGAARLFEIPSSLTR